jgi:G3E family GTPase
MYQKLRIATKRRLCRRVIPATILIGFLGSGKSTLARHILMLPDHGRRIVVVENEFGRRGGGGGRRGDLLANQMGLSIKMVIVRDGTSSSDGGGRRNLLADLIKLPNRCVCRTIKDTLVVMLERLLETRTDIDYILLESIFWLDGALDSRLRLDGIVYCVNACNIGYQLECTSLSHHSLFRAASS